MQQKTFILVAATTGYQVRSFAAAAGRLGISLMLATDRCHILDDPWADRAIPIQFDDPDASAEVIRQAFPDPETAGGIIAVGDGPTLVASLAAERLGLPFHPPQAARICRSKHLLRTAFREAGLLVPNHYVTFEKTKPIDAVGGATYPCVLKPLGLSASRGVIRANNPGEAVAAMERIRAMGEHAIQLEDYIAGREFALEGLMTSGNLQTLAIFDKPDPLEGPFFEETIYVTPSRQPAAIQARIIDTTARAAASIGLSNGPIHAEMRVNDVGVWMLEIAARPIGGLCARALQFDAGSLEELIILHAMGRLPARIVPSTPASGVMMVPVPRAGILGGVEGIPQASAVPGITGVIITAKPGQKLVPLPEGASYTGFLFAAGQTPAAVEQALREAHSQLRFEILAALPVLTN